MEEYKEVISDIKKIEALIGKRNKSLKIAK